MMATPFLSFLPVHQVCKCVGPRTIMPSLTSEWATVGRVSLQMQTYWRAREIFEREAIANGSDDPGLRTRVN